MEVQFFGYKLKKFISFLEEPTRAKIVRSIILLQKFGNELGMPQSKKIGDRLYELRIRGVQEVRIFYTFKDGKAVLLHGYLKKSQKILPKELSFVEKLLHELDKQ